MPTWGARRAPDSECGGSAARVPALPEFIAISGDFAAGLSSNRVASRVRFASSSPVRCSPAAALRVRLAGLPLIAVPALCASSPGDELRKYGGSNTGTAVCPQNLKLKGSESWNPVSLDGEKHATCFPLRPLFPDPAQ
jgi:hypothetical protein